MVKKRKPTIELKLSGDDFKRLEEFADFADEFRSETDRAAVILGAAKLDHTLHQILTTFLLPKLGSSDELLDGDSPLSSFSSKINLCYRLGLIDADFVRALHLIRKIRNSFAHEVSGCNLELSPHRDRVAELITPYKDNHYFELYKQFFFGDEPEAATNFKTLLGLCFRRLDGITRKVKPLTIGGVTPLVKQFKGYKMDVKSFLNEIRSEAINKKSRQLREPRQLQVNKVAVKGSKKRGGKK
jgi:hypothetical protein